MSLEIPKTGSLKEIPMKECVTGLFISPEAGEDLLLPNFTGSQPEKKLPFLGLVIKMSMFGNLQLFSYSNYRIINWSLLIPHPHLYSHY